MKEVYPRPFLSNLMDFLLTTKPRRDETVVNINMDVYLWSSAMPRNVKNMLDRFLSSWRRELLGTWTRDNLDLDPMDYRKNITLVLQRLELSRTHSCSRKSENMERLDEITRSLEGKKAAILHRSSTSQGYRFYAGQRRPHRGLLLQSSTPAVEPSSDNRVYHRRLREHYAYFAPSQIDAEE